MCGICAAVSNTPITLDSIIYRLSLVNHRGHESAGMTAITDKGRLHHYVGAGSAREACHADRPGFREFSKRLNEDSLKAFIGHTRYSTTGSSDIEHGQPIRMDHPHFGPFFLVHNGQLPNHKILRADLERRGQRFFTESDTEVLAALIAHSDRTSLPEAVAQLEHQVPGAYTIIALNRDHLVGARDRYGIWCLWYGQNNDGQLVLASENPALGHNIIGQLLPPGYICTVDLNPAKLTTEQICERQPSQCWLNVAYLSRPDELLGNSITSKARWALGLTLATLNPVKADLVIGVPDSGLSAALGFSHGSQLPFEREGLVRNRFAPGRSFILPGQKKRKSTITEKLSVTRQIVAGKRVVLIDDSVIRANTSRLVTDMLREAQASEVHWRIASPPVKYPCHYGIDMPDVEHLAAHTLDEKQIASKIGADSLQYLNEEAMIKVLNGFHCGWCTACINGNYPLPVK